MATQYQREIIRLKESGKSLEQIASQFGVTPGTINKKIINYEREMRLAELAKSNTNTIKKYPAITTWNIETIKVGVNKFNAEYGRLPSATDFDRVDYLPSARQVQRVYGGMSALRKTLGYGDDISFTKGELRADIARRVNKRGIEFEEKLEIYLIDMFGEPFVHTQKRYHLGTKSRFDFFVYAKNEIFGIDVFAVDDAKNIEKNIRHKIKKYVDTEEDLKVFFVVEGAHSANDLSYSVRTIERMGLSRRFVLVDSEGFEDIVSRYEPLDLPLNVRTLL